MQINKADLNWRLFWASPQWLTFISGLRIVTYWSYTSVIKQFRPDLPFFSLRRCRVVSLLCGPWSPLLSLPATKREPSRSDASADPTLQSGSDDSFKTQELRSSLVLLLAWIRLLSFSHFNRTPFLFDAQQHRVVKCGRHTGDKGAWNPSWPASFPLPWLQQPSVSARPLGGIHRSHLATKMDPFIYTETWSGLIPGPLCWTPALSLSWEASLSQGACGSGRVSEPAGAGAGWAGCSLNDAPSGPPPSTPDSRLLEHLCSLQSLVFTAHLGVCLFCFFSEVFIRYRAETDTVRTTWKLTRLPAVFSNFLDFWVEWSLFYGKDICYYVPPL